MYENAIILYTFVNRKYAHLMLKDVIIEDYDVYKYTLASYFLLFFFFSLF